MAGWGLPASAQSRREFVTHREIEFDKTIAGSKLAIKKLAKCCAADNACAQLFTQLAHLEELRTVIERDCENWLAAANCNVIPVGEGHAAAVLPLDRSHKYPP